MAAASVPPDGTSAVAELAAPLFHRLAVGAHDVRGHRRDVQRLLDTREQRVELGGIHAPRVEHEVRRPKARARVDERRAADAAADGQGDGGHTDRERQTVATIESAQTLRWRAGEIAPVEMLTLFQHDDLESSFGQLFGRDRAARAAADDDHIGGFVETGFRLLDLELDHTWIALDLLIWLAVISDERFDSIVGAEEHQDQSLEGDQGLAALADLRRLACDQVSLARPRAEHSEGAQVPAEDRREIERREHEVDGAAW